MRKSYVKVEIKLDVLCGSVHECGSGRKSMRREQIFFFFFFKRSPFDLLVKVRQQCERLLANRSNKQPRPAPLYPLFPKITVYLQDENEEVDRFGPLVDVVMGRALVAFVKLDLLDHIGVAQDSQQHLV